MESITQLLNQWRAGDLHARDRLFELMYSEMRSQAVAVLRKQWSSARVQPTELVHEAYLKLADLDQLEWQNRAHLLAMAATVMRQVLIDQYRRESADKRSHERVTLVTAHLGGDETAPEYDFGHLNDAIAELHEVSPDYARVVEMKFFGGMTHEEIAAVLDASPTTVKRYWRAARAWLETYITEQDE